MNILEGIPEQRLTLDQEGELASCGSDEARETLVMHALREAYIYSKGCYQSASLSDGAILSACYDGLCRAAKRFRPHRIRFLGYAKADVRGALSKAVKGLYVMKKTRDTEELPPEPEDDDIGSVEVPDKTFKPLLRPTSEPEWGIICVKEEWGHLQPILRDVLTDKERMILELHFQGDLNLQEIGDLLGTTRSDTQNNKMKALLKIRNALVEKKQFYKR